LYTFDRGVGLAQETLERRLLLAGLDAVRQIGGDALVQVLLTQAGTPELAETGTSERVPLEDYLRYRDTALDFLQDSFSSTAYETGRILARRVRRENESQLRALAAQFEHAPNKLPLIGQAAVLGAQGNPGVVRASLPDPQRLLLTIERCPECRGLRREAPFCFLNQGLITEFAADSLRLSVVTRETKCIAVGDRVCEIQVSLQE
jgi:predicted hydrocarbon binding protein